MQKTLKLLREKIKKNYGEKCKDFAKGCFLCDIYKKLEDLEKVVK